jgi:hypothetical protein
MMGDKAMELAGIWRNNGKYGLELLASSDLHANEFITHEYERFPGCDKQHDSTWSN